MPCYPGQYANAAGSVSCLSCVSGKYNDQAGGTACQNCAAGKFSNTDGASSCKICPLGKFGDVTSSAGCKKCAINTFNDATGQIACKACPGGWIARDESVKCDATPAAKNNTPTFDQCIALYEAKFKKTNGSRCTTGLPGADIQNENSRLGVSPLMALISFSVAATRIFL